MKTFLSILLFLVGSYAYGQNSILNVTNFGAVGDAVQFYVNTVSNSTLVTTSNSVPASAIGEVIEIMNAGPWQYGGLGNGSTGYGQQDLIAQIVSISNGTNITISEVCSNTMANTWATYGHDNTANIQAAISRAGNGTNVYVPAGTYLCLCTNGNNGYGRFDFELTNGGFSIFGDGQADTRLLGQFAWHIGTWGGNANNAFRGIMFEEITPILNNLPFTLANITVDGGVQYGNTFVHGEYINPVDGTGWDTSHDAFLVCGPSHGAYDNMTWSNVCFQHWRGEMVKSIDQSQNGNLLVENCTFYDGNATAINIYPSINFTNCVFNNLFQVAEYYQAYSTNTCYFQNNLVTNVTGNGFAINGGRGSNPPFIIKNNTFYLPGNGFNGIETVPADNVVVSNNTFVCGNYAIVIDLGASGYQGTFDNSNIIIAANTVINPSTFVEIGGGNSPTSGQKVESVSVYGNYLTDAPNGAALLLTYGWTTNISFQSNDCSTITNWSVSCGSGNYGAPITMIGTNNLYYTFTYDFNGKTNVLDYASGPRYEIIYGINTNTLYDLADADSNQIPVGAQMLLYNNNRSSWPVPVYLNSALTRGPVSVPAGQTFVATWTNNLWIPAGTITGQNQGGATIQVTPISLAFGTVSLGKSVTNNLVVENVGGGILAGTASAMAPFSIVSGGTYSLGSNQTQTISLLFNPSSAGNYSQNITLTGANGTNVVVYGSATNVPSAVPPTVSPISANALNLGTNPAVLIINPGSFQLSAVASAYQNDPISWQWKYSVNGGPQTVYSLGSGTNPVINLVNTANTGGNTNVWTLQVTDTTYGLSAQSQITTVVVLPPPLSMQVGLHASIN